MPVRKYRSVEDMSVSWMTPGSDEYRRAVRAVLELVSMFAPKRALPPGVFKYRTVEEADADRERWERAGDT
jgi:hypothetical protein